jgi:hypothetical protein
MQLIELDVKGPLELCYDPEWLAVLRSTHGLYTASKHGARLPDNWGGRPGRSITYKHVTGAGQLPIFQPQHVPA